MFHAFHLKSTTLHVSHMRLKGKYIMIFGHTQLYLRKKRAMGSHDVV